jgi:gluconolactonase
MKFRSSILVGALFGIACGGEPAGGGNGGAGGSAAGSGGSAGASGGRGGGGGAGAPGSGGSGGSTAGAGGGTSAGGASGGAGAGGSAATGGAGAGSGGGGAGYGGAGGGGAADGGPTTMDTAPPVDTGPGARALCPEGPFPAPMPGATQTVCQGAGLRFSYNEGPTWVAGQNAFFFTNFVQRQGTGGDIIKYTPGGQCEIFIRDVGCNGLAASPGGKLLAACHQSRNVLEFDLATKQPRVLAERYMNQLLDTPNDLVAHANGTIYFTNPPFELDGRPAGVGRGVFRIDPAGALSLVGMVGPPNGIGLSPDQRRLYVLGGGIWDIDEAGVPSNRRNMFTGGDGMAVDCGGNVYASGSIFNPQGQQIGQYSRSTNLAFGGADGRTLLLAGPGNGVRTVQMNLPGLP